MITRDTAVWQQRRGERMREYQQKEITRRERNEQHTSRWRNGKRDVSEDEDPSPAPSDTDEDESPFEWTDDEAGMFSQPCDGSASTSAATGTS